MSSHPPSSSTATASQPQTPLTFTSHQSSTSISTTTTEDKVPLHRHPSLYLELNTPKGRGVFTSSPIRKGEVVEISPVLIFEDEKERVRIMGAARDGDGTLLGGYTYNWPVPKDRSQPPPSTTTTGVVPPPQALPLGLGSLFNHSSHPYRQNILWTRSLRLQSIIYTAARDIEIGEELCISYGEKSRLWFKDAEDELGNGEEEEEEPEDLLLKKIEI